MLYRGRGNQGRILSKMRPEIAYGDERARAPSLPAVFLTQSSWEGKR